MVILFDENKEIVRHMREHASPPDVQLRAVYYHRRASDVDEASNETN